MNTEHWKALWSTHSSQIIQIAQKAALVVSVLLVGHLVTRLLHRWIKNTNKRIERFDTTLVPTLCASASAVVYTVSIVIILDAFGVNTNSILALMGAAGLAIALALKDTLSNIAAGMMLLILRPFRKDHFIEAGSIVGTVKEVGLFTTILETPDGIYISAPNSSLWGTPIKNFTRNGKRRMDLVVGISYSDSIERGFEALQKVIKDQPLFLADPAPSIMVKAMADSSVNLQLRAWATVDDYWNVYWATNKKMKEEIEAAGLTIPFPQTDVHLYNEKETA